MSGEEDVYAVADWELEPVGTDPAKLEAETSGRGRWLLLEFKPSTAKLDREAKQMTLVGDAITGFRNDNLLLPSANFASFVNAWKWDAEKAPELEKPSEEVFERLHPNVADRIRMTLDRHIRPNISAHPDFFTVSRGNSVQSSTTNPVESEPTTSIQE